MKRLKINLLISLLFLQFFAAAQAIKQERITNNFDRDWAFIQQDVSGAEKPGFDDKAWRKLNVPHDWSIEGAYDKTNLTARGGGYLPSGTGWYRKSFSLDESLANKKITIEFDGVMANSDVWINGFHLGKRPYGYISFNYDLTKHLNFGKGKTNVIAVKADNTVQPASRYYTGAGIYRNVRLVATDLVHINDWGVFITTPEATIQKATVKVQTSLSNESANAAQVTIETTVLDAAGKVLKTIQSKQNIAASQSAKIEQDIVLSNPKLWNPETPVLYKTLTKVILGAKVVDDQVNSFGIRSFKFDAATGFWMNGKNFKLKGACLHHDGGAVGAAVPLSVWAFRLNKLKEAGVNAIRTAHNPVAPEFLDLCDQMGFLVMDETFDTWTAAKNNGEKGYNRFWKDWWERDTRDMVMRDRNHPSIVIYSVGNEIHDDLNSPEGFKKYKDQQDLVHQLDPSRPVTMALFRPANSKVYTNGFAETMDVVGQNYRENELVALHNQKPSLKVIGTENTHVIQQYLALRDNPFMAGQFLWTGFDYLGESDWPQITNGQGLFDRIGEWKQQSLQRQSWWSEKPTVHIVRKEDNAGAGDWINNWTPTDFDTYDDAKVAVYSNCDEVELFLNGKSLGSKPKPADDSPRLWDVTFEKGSIKAVGKNKGKVVSEETLKTAGPPAKLVLSVDQNKISTAWDDVAFLKVTIYDEQGNICPNADNLIKFTVSDAGIIDVVDNGNIISHEPYKAQQRHAYHGVAMANIKARTAGNIEIKVSAEGLEGASLKLTATENAQTK
ncbi:glycoside hydrolase family 2 TIM barrel-domain containing protein [Pedobacter sp. BMA]|uniref:glycoside hydrolase family 2 TIM barrel-domain containing protein n=1 Tax=Pedobacter sp. BMA TaxID=1663685 RepID=UPI00064AD120|nr:glycoside hydrolase family 2 TIM barrel-domain containing protein [Pedobacter sp. BMA]KLT67424.1 glycoside hydrolase family 2 [Pedobacter sp. BMA]